MLNIVYSCDIISCLRRHFYTFYQYWTWKPSRFKKSVLASVDESKHTEIICPLFNDGATCICRWRTVCRINGTDTGSELRNLRSFLLNWQQMTYWRNLKGSLIHATSKQATYRRWRQRVGFAASTCCTEHSPWCSPKTLASTQTRCRLTCFWRRRH